MNVGRTTARLSTILSIRPSTAVAKPICSCAASSTLPNECDSGSHRYCRSSGRQDAEPVDRRALVDPVVVGQLDALGPAGGARGVDQRGQVLRADRRRPPRRPRPGSRRASARPALGQVVQGQLPLRRRRRRRRAVTTCARSGSLVGQLAQQLAALVSSSANATTAPESVTMCRTSSGWRGRVDVVVAAPAQFDREVGEHPLDPGGGETIDPVLGLQPEGEQAGGELGRPARRSRPQVIDSQRSAPSGPTGPAGRPPRVGVAATRSASIRATEGARWIASVTVDLLVAAVLGCFSGCQIPPGTGGDRPGRYGECRSGQEPTGGGSWPRRGG